MTVFMDFLICPLDKFICHNRWSSTSFPLASPSPKQMAPFSNSTITHNALSILCTKSTTVQFLAHRITACTSQLVGFSMVRGHNSTGGRAGWMTILVALIESCWARLHSCANVTPLSPLLCVPGRNGNYFPKSCHVLKIAK